MATELNVSRETAATRLNEQIQTGAALAEEFDIHQPGDQWQRALRRWVNFTTEMLEATFRGAEPSEFTRAVSPRNYVVTVHSVEQELANSQQNLSRGLDVLELLRDRLVWAEEPEAVATSDAAVEPDGPVFVVHGHDETMLAQVQLMVERTTGRHAIILREEANGGRTIVEQLERHGQSAAYAVVLLTHDDVGRAKDAEDLEPRARQNVVFEMGFFYGLIGRGRVAVLYAPGVELPSDLGGIVYIKIDRGRVENALARELAASGITVDHGRVR